SGLSCVSAASAAQTIPFVIQPGDTSTCTFTYSVNGNGPTAQTDTVTVSGADDENTAVTGTAQSTVTINNVAPTVSTSLTTNADCQTSVTLTGSFSDAGGNDGPYSVDIN